MPRFHKSSTASKCVAFVMAMCFAFPAVTTAQQTFSGSQENAAMLSVLDPNASFDAQASFQAESHHDGVQQASFQSDGIVTRATVPPRTQPTNQFPYRLTAQRSVPVRSAPSQTSYATDYLQSGDQVEVYRHDPDGWLAIRPPQGSFSLVKASDTRRTGTKNVVLVAKDRTKAWVGSRVEQTQQPVMQVQLKAEDKLLVQSTIEVQQGAGKQIWLQVEPPSGEFRWVHQSHFQRSAKPQADAVVSSQVPGRYQSTSSGQLSGIALSDSGEFVSHGSASPDHSSANDTLDLPDVPPLSLTGADSEPTWRAAQRETPELGFSDYGAADSDPSQNRLADASAGIAGESGDGQVFQNVSYRDGKGAEAIVAQQPPTSPASDWDAAVRRLSQNKEGFYQSGTVEAGAVAQPSAGASAGVVSSGDWNQHMNRLSQQLGQEIVKPAPQWSLAPLLQQSQVLIQSAPSAAQRDAAATLQKRILGFLQLQKQEPTGNDLTAGIQGARYASAGGYLPPAAATQSGTIQPVNYEIPYAAVGYLKELIIDRGRQPNSFVLQDITGKTLCHVSPMPGVQLHQYLDQKIGVKGKPGYHAQFRLPHVTVESLDRLN